MFVFRRQTHWRNLVSPPRPLSPAEITREIFTTISPVVPGQRAFGRLTIDAPKILWTYIGSKPVHWTIIFWRMPLRVRSYVACSVHRNFLKFNQLWVICVSFVSICKDYVISDDISQVCLPSLTLRQVLSAYVSGSHQSATTVHSQSAVTLTVPYWRPARRHNKEFCFSFPN